MLHNWENYFNISSKYWQKVQRIYEESEHFPKIVVKDRNLHHKFPRSFSKKDGVEIDNDLDNLVSLSLSDHFLVHYYLWKCANKGYRGMMALAFNFMRKKMIKYASEETIEQLAKDYEAAMKEASEAISKVNKGRTFSEETKKKMSEASKGKKKSEKTKKKMSEAQKGHLGWNKGKHFSVETKKKMSEAKKNMSDETKKKIGDAQKGNKNMLGKRHSEETRKRMSEAHKGSHHSEEAIKKTAEANRGKRWYHNDVENFYCYECPPGCEPGMLKRK